jgi:hypothetical protein
MPEQERMFSEPFAQFAFQIAGDDTWYNVNKKNIRVPPYSTFPF